MNPANSSLAQNKIIDLSFMSAKYGVDRNDVIDFYADMWRSQVLQITPQMAPNWCCRKYFNGNASDFVTYFNQNPNVFFNPNWQKLKFTGQEYVSLLKNPPIKKNVAIVGLFGSGRTALQQICAKTRPLSAIFQTNFESIGYNADHPIIASGHACVRHFAEFQMTPDETKQKLLNPAESDEHRIVFVTRNIFDSVLSNWAWWVHFTRIGEPHLLGRRHIFGSDEKFINYTEENIEVFFEFCKSGTISHKPRSTNSNTQLIKFLSLPEYQDETELWLSNKNVQPLHFEDLVQKKDPAKVIEKIFGQNAGNLLNQTNFVGNPSGYVRIFSISPSIKDVFSAIIGPAHFDKLRGTLEKRFF